MRKARNNYILANLPKILFEYITIDRIVDVKNSTPVFLSKVYCCIKAFLIQTRFIYS